MRTIDYVLPGLQCGVALWALFFHFESQRKRNGKSVGVSNRLRRSPKALFLGFGKIPRRKRVAVYGVSAFTMIILACQLWNVRTMHSQTAEKNEIRVAIGNYTKYHLALVEISNKLEEAFVYLTAQLDLAQRQTPGSKNPGELIRESLAEAIEFVATFENAYKDLRCRAAGATASLTKRGFSGTGTYTDAVVKGFSDLRQKTKNRLDKMTLQEMGEVVENINSLETKLVKAGIDENNEAQNIALLIERE